MLIEYFNYQINFIPFLKIMQVFFLNNKLNYLKIILFKLILFDRILVRYKEGKDEAVFKEKIFRK